MAGLDVPGCCVPGALVDGLAVAGACVAGETVRGAREGDPVGEAAAAGLVVGVRAEAKGLAVGAVVLHMNGGSSSHRASDTADPFSARHVTLQGECDTTHLFTLNAEAFTQRPGCACSMAVPVHIEPSPQRVPMRGYEYTLSE